MKKVLVIDDVEGVRMSIRLGLGDLYHVTDVDTFERGVAHALTNEFDVILCDLKLSDKAGPDIIRELKATGAKAPIIAISGFIHAYAVADAEKAGAAAYLPKPFQKKDLIAVLERFAPSGTA
jgi:CheY-like chemotaxis protein